ncbi:MAG: flagellar basal body P-ring formation protein FlgA [Gammaproteobacteria bacterium]|nr:flagellar basal body P-ring formation protein FlgA [Gammaproteobacteria bacterium]
MKILLRQKSDKTNKHVLLVYLFIMLLGNHAIAIEARALNLQNSIEQFVRAEHADAKSVTINMELDQRLQLACNTPINLQWPAQARRLGKTSLQVRCDHSDKPWQLYIPLDVQVVRPVLVARSALMRGTTLTANDVEIAEQNVSYLLQGYWQTPQEVVGQQLRRNLQQGEVLSGSAVINPPLVKQGENVIIRASSSTLAVNSSGIALNTARLGETLRARSHSSARVIQGVVIARGIVEVPL